MEIRCSGCTKLFRIPDEKITGKGIKFACTRCGASVKVTKEEFEQYALSKSAVAALDLLEEKPKPVIAPHPAGTGKPEATEPSLARQEHEPTAPATTPLTPESQSPPVEEQPMAAAPTEVPERKEPGHAAPPVSGPPQENPVQQSGETGPPSEPSPIADNQPLSKTVPEAPPATHKESNHEPEQEPPTESKQAIPSEPQQLSKEPEHGPVAEHARAEKAATPETAADSSHAVKEESLKTAHHERLTEAIEESLSSPASKHREPASYVPPAQTKNIQATPVAPSRSLNMFLVYSVMIVLIVLVGYGVFKFIGPGNQKTDELLKELSSTEGLRIVSASGSVDPKGDLIITCMIENSLNKERPVWYVVIDVYNDQGAVVGKIRSINGKQLYTHRDYDIFSKRGANTQELKLMNLQDQGVVIPPKGSVTFDVRYLQPASGVTSFNALVHPFDPVRLFKEISEEIQQ